MIWAIVALVAATFLCALVAGFLFAFAAVVMPGIHALDDREYLRAFQVIDGVIQKGQPLFMVVWLGSAVALLATAVLCALYLGGVVRFVPVPVLLLYLGAVQFPTIAINIPLNNRVQALQLEALDEDALRTERAAFEPRWVRWNTIRTVVASAVTLALMAVLAAV